MNRRIKDINGEKYPYVVVPESYWRKYYENAFVDEPQQLCSSLDEAERVCSSYIRAEGRSHVIIELRGFNNYRRIY